MPPGSGTFENLRFRYIVWTVVLAQLLLAYGDADARGFHLLVLVGTLAGLYLPDRIRLAVPVTLWNIVVVALLGLSFMWIRRDISKIFEILLYFLEVLLIVKAFSRRSSRDYWQILLACYFVLIAGVISLSSIWILPILIVFVALMSLAMVADTLAEPEIPQPEFQQPVLAEQAKRFPDLGWGTAGVVVLTVIIAVINFVAIPRLSRAFFDLGFMRSGGGTRTGLSGQVDLSQRGAIEQDPEIIGRLRVIDPTDTAPGQRKAQYLVGKRLDRFDGIKWSASPGPVARVPISSSRVHWIEPDDAGRPSVKYGLLLKPSAQPFVLQMPGTAALHFANTVQVLRDERLDNLTFEQLPAQVYRYEGWSPLETRASALSGARLMELTAVPEIVSPKIRELAKTVGGSSSATRDIARRIYIFFSQNFEYSLQRPQGAGPDVMDKFLFDDRRGHCEYFASAAAILARLSGVPARLVTGYLVADRTGGGDWLIREQDAHAWVEYYDPVQGWKSLDPSPRDPEAEKELRHGWKDQLATIMGQLEFWWFDAVIDFDLGDQFEMLQTLLKRLNPDPGERAAEKARETTGKIQMPTFGTREFYDWAAVIVATLVVAGWGVRFWVRRKAGAGAHPATRELDRLLRAFGRSAPVSAAGETPARAVRSAAEKSGVARRHSDQVRLWIELYQRVRFGPTDDRRELVRLKNVTDELIASVKEKQS